MLHKLKLFPAAVSRFLQKPPPVQWRLLNIAVFSFYFRLMILCLPFRYTGKWLGSGHQSPDSVSPQTISDHQKRNAAEIAGHIKAVSRVVPWTSNCLVQAALGKKFLSQHQIPGIVYLGVKKDGKHAMKAHAWLQTGSDIILGEEFAADYTAVSAYI